MTAASLSAAFLVISRLSIIISVLTLTFKRHLLLSNISGIWVFLKNRSRYSSLFNLDIKNYRAWAKGLKKAGYATDKNYSTKLIDIIDNYNLKIYDLRKEIASLQKEILDETKTNSMKSKLHSMEAKLENTCNKHKKDLKFFETYDDCPTCQQAIDAAFKATMIDKKKEKVAELDSALGQIDKEIKTRMGGMMSSGDMKLPF